MIYPTAYGKILILLFVWDKMEVIQKIYIYINADEFVFFFFVILHELSILIMR